MGGPTIASSSKARREGKLSGSVHPRGKTCNSRIRESLPARQRAVTGHMKKVRCRLWPPEEGLKEGRELERQGRMQFVAKTAVRYQGVAEEGNLQRDRSQERRGVPADQRREPSCQSRHALHALVNIIC